MSGLPVSSLSLNSLGVAFLFAWRELRSGLHGGFRGFRLFVACLALGVGAIAGVNSLSEAVQGGLRADARALAGGDLTVRTTYNPATPEQVAWFRAAGRVSLQADMRAMAGTPARRTMVELKAVDDAYPLYGSVALDPPLPLDAALARRDDGRQGSDWGAVVDGSLLDQLGLAVGDRIGLGDADYVIRARIAREPDRGISLLNFGPRFLVALDSLPETGLLQPGSLVRYHYKLALPPGTSAQASAAALAEAFPDAPWQVTRFDEAAPGLRNTVTRLALFLTLVGLTALLIGGVGVANAVRSYVGSRRTTIAIFRCLGAPARIVFATYLLQVMALATIGVAIGLALGALAPALLAGTVGALLPVRLQIGLYPGPLLLAAAFGYLTALAFALWPLARAQEVPAAGLFRDLVAPVRRLPRPAYLAATGLAGAALAGLTVATADDRAFAAWFVAGAAGALLLFLGAAWAVTRLAAAAGRPRRPALRLALANLHRPGAPTGSVVLSLGFAVTVLAAVALIEGNLARRVVEQIPERAPTFFFIDIQKSQVEPFASAAAAIAGVEVIDRMPHIRARITRIDGVPVSEARIAPESQWAVRNERGLTYSREPPPRSRIVAGAWWPPDYSGPPLISLDAGLARGFGIGVGDTLGFNLLGREITARIANLRQIDWGDLQMQFAVIFAPGALDAAPQTFIATASAPPEAEAALVRAVTDRFSNISAIRVRDALDRVEHILGQIGAAVRITALIGLLAGALVLAGAIAAGQRRRIYDAVVLRVLGATRRDIPRAYVLEFLLLGIATAAVGAGVGTATAWIVVAEVMRPDWTFLPRALLGATALCLGVTLLFGCVGVWRALGQKAAPLLRHS